MNHASSLVTGRFAPSPTGALHTGSLVAAVGSWLMAKSTGGRWLVRIDDLDAPRRIPGMADDILRTLERFGLHWDGEVSRQSSHLEAYEHHFQQLCHAGLVYPCGCSRREIALSASAAHPDDDGIAYGGACRNGMRTGAVVRSCRVRVTDEMICFNDLRNGTVCQRLSEQCGDFVVKRGDGVFAYQLAVVVDDYLTGVTQVVRGDDLLASTPRQVFLQRLMGLPTPEYCHLPLVTGPNGVKLSKRDNLVSCQLEIVQGKEGVLLRAVFRFLGMTPPAGLDGAPCAELIAWGLLHFRADLVPAAGGELIV